MKKLKYYWEKLKSKPLLYNIVMALVALLVLSIISHVLMQIGTRHGARRMVPDFTGVSFDDAQHIARENDLDLFVNDSLYVPAYAGGVILDQLPEKGVEVKPGRTIYITINSYKQKMARIPYVAGRSLRQAKNMLEIAGFEIAELKYHDDMATNYVLEEYYDKRPILPSSKTEAEVGSGITLYVGLQGGHGMTVVPGVIGMNLQQAKSRLWEQGLNVGNVSFDEGINLLNKKDARVYIQSPRQEEGLAYGTAVNMKLTLDKSKAEKSRAESDKTASKTARLRIKMEQEVADSLAQIAPNEPSESANMDDNNDSGFF